MTTPSDDLDAAAVRADLEAMANLCSAPMDLWDRFSNGVLNLLSERLADKARIAELEGERDEEPGEPGAFEGDIFFGDRVHTARGTHRWANGTWDRLPSDEEILTDLLGKARARALSAEAALRASQEALGKAVEVIAERIYNDWREQFGWVPWVSRGNSFKQDDARRSARQTLAQVEGVEGQGALPMPTEPPVSAGKEEA